MNPDLWIINPFGAPAALPWALAVELDLVGLQRLTLRQWEDLAALLPCPI
jgi:hypothetical protein